MKRREKKKSLKREIGHSYNSALHRQMSPDQLNYTDKERLGLCASLSDLKSDRFSSRRNIKHTQTTTNAEKGAIAKLNCLKKNVPMSEFGFSLKQSKRTQ